MKISQIKKLHNGDTVFWTDPDDGLCSDNYIIGTIKYLGEGVVSIIGKDGRHLECFARELS